MDDPQMPLESDLTPALIVRLRAGDRAAGELLERLYRRDLTRFCAGYLGAADQAEDAVQDVFCKVLAAETVPESFRSWVYRIARNRCLDLLRGRARRRDDQALPSESAAAEELTGHLTRLVRQEQHSRLRQLVAALPATQREILRLRYVEGLSRQEIADVLELPESIVKSRLFEGLERLRQHTSLVNPA
jgi:RNA polymerase sigma-70 factor (ECF subfamily)